MVNSGGKRVYTNPGSSSTSLKAEADSYQVEDRYNFPYQKKLQIIIGIKFIWK